MGDIAVRAENLGKCYRLGEQRLRTFRDLLGDLIRKPLNRTRNLLGGSESYQNTPGFDENAGVIWSLRNASFEVKRGETIGIIGRNGAGKSTLLSLLCRVTAPTTGTAEVYGRVASLLEVGTGFHHELSGRDNVFLSGAIMGMSKSEIQSKFDEIVAFAEIGRFIDTAVKYYSSGMFVRLGFSVACHMDPDILVADEALNVGDMVFQQKCLEKIRSIASEGRTVLFVSHNIDTVRSLCHRAIWLRNGQISMMGPTLEVTEKYIEDIFSEGGRITELREAPREEGFGHQFRFCRLEINDDKPVQHGEMLRLRMEYETRSDVKEVALSFVFSTLHSTRIMSVDSDLSEARKSLPGGKRGIIEVILDKFLLQPGQYLLDIRARSGDLKTLDYLPACTRLNVVPGAATPRVVNHDGSGLRIAGSWEWM